MYYKELEEILVSDVYIPPERYNNTPESRYNYYRNYWIDCGCDRMAPELAKVVFDIGVRHGVSRVNKWVQTCIGACCTGEYNKETINKLNLVNQDKLLLEIRSILVKYEANING